MTKKCLMCAKEFNIPFCRKDTAKYCSLKCHGKFSITKVIKKCLVCKRDFSTNPHEIKRGWGKFCSRKCMGISRQGKSFSEKWKRNLSESKKRFLKLHPDFGKGSNNSYWKGGKTKDTLGYIFIYSPSHPHHNHSNYVREHRLVMEKHIGRFLTKEEVVHHRNEIRDDNRIENLKLFPNESEHQKFHNPKGSPVAV